jgi:hypothetical protein
MAKQESLALSDDGVVTIGNRTMSARGFTHNNFAAHLRTHLGSSSGEWCDPGCMGRFMFGGGRTSPRLRREIRKRLGRAFLMMLDRGMFVVIQYDPRARGQASAFKILDSAGGEEERQAAQYQLVRMLRRGEITATRLALAREIAGIDPEPHQAAS